ncbi:MAG TPA: peptide ABC transporter substrate-binding protein [Pseudomonadales bacterium]|nr:peptide ABC transporter substrate-binding protein [Pseudomonadales bacterium]
MMRVALRVALLGAILLGATGTRAAPGDGVDLDTRTLTLVLEQEPPQLDSSRSTDQISFRILGHVMEGLTRMDGAGHVVPGLAEHWEIRADGARFRLREGALWNDGVPVTAHDFVFAWRNLVDPRNASDYAFVLSGVAGADAIVRGEAPVEALGVRAVSDRELEVVFERPIAWFDKLAAFQTLLPLREDFYRARAGRYAADADEMLFTGPFVISRWSHGARIELRRNPRYWDADSIWLNAIDFAYVTSDTSAMLNLFKDGRIALAPLDRETMQTALERRWRILSFLDGSVFFVELNQRPGRPTANVHLRRALALAFDGHELVNRIVAVPGTLPTNTIFPSWLQGAKQRLRREIPAPVHVADQDAARRELELAKQALGVTEIPPLVMLTDDAPGAVREAEFLQTLWGEVLGLEVRIDRQIFKQRLEKRRAGDFDFSYTGWGPDYDDPLTFGDLFASWNLNNRGRYASDDTDACIRTAQSSIDPVERVAAFDCIQRTLIADQALIPTYERSLIYVVDPRMRGLIRRQAGTDPDYSRVWFAAPQASGAGD